MEKQLGHDVDSDRLVSLVALGKSTETDIMNIS